MHLRQSTIPLLPVNMVKTTMPSSAFSKCSPSIITPNTEVQSTTSRIGSRPLGRSTTSNFTELYARALAVTSKIWRSALLAQNLVRPKFLTFAHHNQLPILLNFMLSSARMRTQLLPVCRTQSPRIIHVQRPKQ